MKASPRILRHSEADVLTAFWALVQVGQDRLDLLKEMAAIGIRRPDDWRPLRIRHEFEIARPRGRGSECFTCLNRDRARAWHHVIQIQHGGSNVSANLVPVCVLCHSRVHLWLPTPEMTALSGWSSMLEIVQSNYPKVEAMLEQSSGPA
jgi:hypothetical protein